MTPSRQAENEALIEIRSALQSEKLRDAADRAEHARRFGPPVFAWVKDERNGRMRRVQLPFAAEPELAELIAQLAGHLRPCVDDYGQPYQQLALPGFEVCVRIRNLLVSYPGPRQEYHAHGWAVSLGSTQFPCHFRPYHP